MQINEGTANRPRYVKHKEEAYFCEEIDVEYILNTIIEFEDICDPDCLNITTAVQRKKHFRLCLGDIVRTRWDAAVDNMPITMAGYNLAMENFISKFIKTHEFLQQKLYMENYKYLVT